VVEQEGTPPLQDTVATPFALDTTLQLLLQYFMLLSTLQNAALFISVFEPIERHKQKLV